MKKYVKLLTALSLSGMLVFAAGAAGMLGGDAAGEGSYVDQVAMENEAILLEGEAMAQVPRAALPELPTAGETTPGEEAPSVEENAAPAAQPAPALLEPQASGVLVKGDKKSVIDYSNTGDGYVMVQFTGQSEKRLKAQVKGPTTTYTYNLTAGEWEVFPLSDGSGGYKISVFENVSDNKYALVGSLSHDVTLKDEFAPFLRPNQYVDYTPAVNSVTLAGQLTQGMTDPLKKVEAVYRYVVGNLSYDYEKAATVKSGYLPVLDNVLESKKGICFDYAALMTGMLRSQGVPCKLVVGYAGQAYHAWISVWTAETGWIEGVVYFNGTAWQRMDPTFASSAQQSQQIMDFINSNANYTVKYLY